MGYYKVGDVVEITKLIALDEELGGNFMRSDQIGRLK